MFNFRSQRLEQGNLVIMNKEDLLIYNGDGTVLRKAQSRLLELLKEFDRICKKHNIQYFLSGGTCLGAVRHGGFIPWDDDIDIDIWHEDYNRFLMVLPAELSNSYNFQTLETDPNFHRKYLRIVDIDSKVTYKNNQFRERFRFDGLWIDIFPLNKCFSYRIRSVVDHFYLASMRNLFVKNSSLWKNIAAWIIYPIAVLSKYIFETVSKYFTPTEKISHVIGTGMSPKLKMSDCFPVKPLYFEGLEFMGPANPQNYLRYLYGSNFMDVPPRNKRITHSESISIGGQ